MENFFRIFPHNGKYFSIVWKTSGAELRSRGVVLGGDVFGLGAGKFPAVEGGADIGAVAVQGLVAGVGAQAGAVAGEEEGGGDGADGGGAAEGGDNGLGGKADGEGRAESDSFGGDHVRGAVVHDGADEDEPAVGEFLLKTVPVLDGAAAGGIVGAEEQHELDLAGVLAGADFARKLRQQVFQREIADGRNGDGRGGGGLLAAAGRKEN